jgi:hypothetical protein
MLRDVPFDIIHTAYTADETLMDLKAKRVFPDITRVTEFKTIFSDPKLDLQHSPHYIVDSNPPLGKVFRDILFIRTLASWFLNLSSRKPTDMASLFYKTHAMREVDWFIECEENALKDGYENGLLDGKEKLGQVVAMLTPLEQEIANKERVITSTEALLQELDTQALVCTGSKSVAESSGLIWSQSHKIELHSKYIIRDAKTTEESENTYFTDKTYFNDYKSFSITANSRIWAGTYASVSIYAYKKDIHALEIMNHRTQLSYIKEALYYLKAKKNTLLLENDKLFDEIKTLQDKVNRTPLIMAKLNEVKITLDFYTKVIDSYRNFDKDNKKHGKFIRDVYDESLPSTIETTTQQLVHLLAPR